MFRAAGWSADSAEIKRTYSPPIPAAVTSEYFQAPKPSRNVDGLELGDDEEGEGGMVTGGGNSEAVALAPVRRRKRREQLEDDDSSDLSDESDEDESEVRQIRFTKMPARIRSGSSPIRSVKDREAPPVQVSSPAKLPEATRPRGSSLSAVELMKTRTRRDTTTSSDISTESDLDPSVFQRRILKSRPGRATGTLARQIEEDEEDELSQVITNATDDNALDSDVDSLASDFSETLGPESLLAGTLRSSPLRVSAKASAPEGSPRKRKQSAPVLQDLPPPRPISFIKPVSALGMALRALKKKPKDPFARFASLSGDGDPNPLYLKIYLPAAEKDEPLEILIRKTTNDGDAATVAETIGFVLWKYGEEKVQPVIASEDKNVNKWTFRIVEDEEVDYDFPPLARTKLMSDFASNNARKGRARGKPWDEFALVKATEAQFAENEAETPKYSEEAAVAEPGTADNGQGIEQAAIPETQATPPSRPRPYQRGNPITDPYFNSAYMRKESVVPLADAPSTPALNAAQPSGQPRTLTIHYTSTDFTPRTLAIDTTADAYIAEIFDQACKKLRLDKALYMFKISNTNTVAPTDRTVEALGPTHSDLDLVRRRFVAEGGTGTFGSPSSTSPNAPILSTSAAPASGTGTPKKSKNVGGSSVHPLAQQQSASQGGDAFTNLGLGLSFTAGGSGLYKRYNVIRKQHMSLAPSHPRVLELSGEFLHILPGDPGTANRGIYDPVVGKTVSVPFGSVVGCKVNRKHPKTFRMIIYREKETKRYDFEAASEREADTIVSDIRLGIETYKTTE